MGLYDTFVDGEKEVQLKNFECCMANYEKGDKIPMRRFRYPKNGLFFCWATRNGVVVIKNNIFIGIEPFEALNEKGLPLLKKYPFRIWDCSGSEYRSKKEART
jgi:hypothetical protein